MSEKFKTECSICGKEIEWSADLYEQYTEPACDEHKEEVKMDG